MSGGAGRNPNSWANLKAGTVGPATRAKWIAPKRVPVLVRLFTKERLTTYQLAERFGVSRCAIAGMLWRAGARKQ
jgi:hypothetical protein